VRLLTDLNYAGRGWYRRNAAFVLVGGLIIAVAYRWWIGLLLVFAGLGQFIVSERMLPIFARRRRSKEQSTLSD
jgi:hypothetical protein